MMKPIRPDISKGASYPAEFREEAVRYWLSSGQTLVAVASALGLSPQCLRDWRKQMDSDQAEADLPAIHGGEAGSAVGHAQQLAVAREIGQLRRDLEAMTRQRDILKKAISIFSEDKIMSGGLK